MEITCMGICMICWHGSLCTLLQKWTESADYPNMQFLTCYPLGGDLLRESPGEGQSTRSNAIDVDVWFCALPGTSRLLRWQDEHDCWADRGFTYQSGAWMPLPAGLLKDRGISWKRVVPDVLAERWWEMVGKHMQDSVVAEAVPLCLRKHHVWSCSAQSWERPALAHIWEDLGWLEKWDNKCFMKLNKDKCKILQLGQLVLTKASGCISTLV